MYANRSGLRTTARSGKRDTYFEVANGGLKLREERPGRPHLIQFERADESRQRESRYRIIDVDDGPMLSAALAAAIGVRVVVTKRRRLFLWREVRIHLDNVERLGRFIELEAVAPPGSDLTQEHQLIAELRDALAIADGHLIAVGYAEQLRAKGAAAWVVGVPMFNLPAGRGPSLHATAGRAGSRRRDR